MNGRNLLLLPDSVNRMICVDVLFYVAYGTLQSFLEYSWSMSSARTLANADVLGEVIRYNRASKVYGFNVGDYARVTATNHEKNEITVQRPDGQEITSNPARLSGVNVYRESNRTFAEGDRIQFRAPFTEHRIANGELGTIEQMRDEQFTVALDSGREISFEPDKFRHLDQGYAVTSYSSQSQTVDRVLVNADARESDLLLNQRMGYVAISRAREDAVIFTTSAEQLRAALDRNVDKEMAVEALRLDQNRKAPSQEQLERLVSPASREASDEQSLAQRSIVKVNIGIRCLDKNGSAC
ncbi:MAG: conjugative relaxase domain protein [Acidobacteria bacterium]|nr:conjugative relaxase domain protein [Acidobacteriota bacterium]